MSNPRCKVSKVLSRRIVLPLLAVDGTDLSLLITSRVELTCDNKCVFGATVSLAFRREVVDDDDNFFVYACCDAEVDKTAGTFYVTKLNGFHLAYSYMGCLVNAFENAAEILSETIGGNTDVVTFVSNKACDDARREHPAKFVEPRDDDESMQSVRDRAFAAFRGMTQQPSNN